MADGPRFSTRMAWDGSGDGHWDVVLTEMTDGRARVLATIPLDEWISLGATQYAIELHNEALEEPDLGVHPVTGVRLYRRTNPGD